MNGGEQVGTIQDQVGLEKRRAEFRSLSSGEEVEEQPRVQRIRRQSGDRDPDSGGGVSSRTTKEALSDEGNYV